MTVTTAETSVAALGDDARAIEAAAPAILVVDDTPLNLDLLERILCSEGFRALRASGGDEALKLVHATPVDLILLDVMMPGRSGLEICADLKRDPVTTDIPVIFLSALNSVKSRIAGLKAGGADYIAKPWSGEEVLARVRVHLRNRQAVQLLAREQQTRLSQLRQAQQSILVLPEDLPEACFAACYRPLDAVGGDMYDVLPLGEDVMAYFVADISGHSVEASFLTSAVKALLRQYSGPMFSAEDTMRGINSVMRSTLNGGQFLTACYARLYKRRRRLSVISAGHPPPIHVSAAGEAGTVRVQSEPLGIFGSVVLQKQDISVTYGDRFYLYTDGLIEDYSLPGAGRATGLERLRKACECRHHLPLREAVDAIVEDVRPDGEPVDDDLLLLAVEVRE